MQSPSQTAPASYLLPDDLADILRAAAGASTTRYMLRFEAFRDAFALGFREEGGAITMITARGEAESRERVGTGTADLWQSRMPGVHSGSVLRFALADASGEPHPAAAYLPANRRAPAVVEIPVPWPPSEQPFAPPGWMAACRAVSGSRVLTSLLGNQTPTRAGPVAVRALADLLAPGAQSALRDGAAPVPELTP